MIRSMTGFGRAEGMAENLNITVEIKSVNHRYFEWSARIPHSFSFLEEPLKSYCKQHISRGKTELFVSIESVGENSTAIEINREYTDAYVNALKTLACEYGLRDDISVCSVAQNRDVFVFTKPEIDEEKATEAVLNVAAKAVESFLHMRAVEGERLKADLENRVGIITDKVTFIEKRSPETVRLYREKLEQRIRDLLESATVDEQRLLTETAIFADKVAVDEETVRLRSHMKQLCDLLNDGGVVDRKLDFIVQEMNRESNTIGSKAQDMEITQCVVDIKAEIEKIREQVQNIE